MSASKEATDSVWNKEMAQTKSQVNFTVGKVWSRRSHGTSLVSVFRDIFTDVKMCKLSGFLMVLVLVLCPTSGHCIPGTDWQINVSSPQEDVGANSYTTAYLNVTYVDPDTKKLRSEKSEIAKFGDGKVGPASGVLVHVSSWEGGYTGCAVPLRSSFGNGSLPQEPWIALVKRGQCNFEVKVENALRHNASAILVYNDRESPTLDKMKLTGTRNMSAVFTYKWKGEQLAKLVDNGSRIMMHITVATHCTRPNAHVNRTSVLFVSISFVVLMLTSLAWLVFYYVQRFRYLHAKDRLSKRLCNAAKKALSRIPTKEIQQEDQEVQGEGECCAVCIEPYKVTDDLRILPCRHEFHKGCIDPWLLEHRTCPMCKMNILKHYGFVFSNSQESVLHVDLERRPDEETTATVAGNNSNQDAGRSSGINQSDTSTAQHQNGCSRNGVDGYIDQTNQLLNGESEDGDEEDTNRCLKCGSKAERTFGKNVTPKTIIRGSNRDAVQLLNDEKTRQDAEPKNLKPFDDEGCTKSDKTVPGHFGGVELVSPKVCDNVDNFSTNPNKKSLSCNAIDTLTK